MVPVSYTPLDVYKRQAFYDADAVTMDEIEVYLSDDANNMLSNFENGSWQLIDDVPTAEMKRLDCLLYTSRCV